MTAREKVFARMQRAHVLKDGRALIVLLAAVEIAHVAPVWKDSVNVILDGKVLNVTGKRHVSLLTTARQKFMEYVRQQIFASVT